MVLIVVRPVRRSGRRDGPGVVARADPLEHLRAAVVAGRLLVWPAVGPWARYFWSDGRFFGFGDVGSPVDPRDVDEDAFEQASDLVFEWGRSPSVPPPPGWRFFDLARDGELGF